MTSTIVWTGIAFWLALNAAFVAVRVHATRPKRITAPALIWIRRPS